MSQQYNIPAIIEYVLNDRRDSAANVARDMGIDPGQFSRYRRGKATPSDETFERIVSDIDRSILSDFIDLNNQPNHGSHDHEIELIKKLYSFQEDGKDKTIYIIPATAGLLSEYKSILSDNHIMVDNYSDRDSLLQISLDLARAYPDRPILPYRDRDFHSGMYDRSIVLIGSRGLVNGDINNQVADIFLQEAGIDITLTDEGVCFKNGVSEKFFKFERNDSGKIVKDVAAAVKFKNPFDESKWVFHFFGHFTWGGAAIARACSRFSPGVSSLLYYTEQNELIENEFFFLSYATIRQHKVILEFEDAFISGKVR